MLHPSSDSRFKTSLKSEVNSGKRNPSAERPELVVTLPRYSPASDIMTVLDPEATDRETLCRDLDSSTDAVVALLDKAGCSSLQSETNDLAQNLIATTDDQNNFDECHEENSSVVLYQPKQNNVIEDRILQLCESARSHMETGDYNCAVVYYTKALSLRPKDVTSIIERGECYLRMADFQSSILNYKRACLLRPENSTYRQRLAFIYYLYGQCLFEQNLFAVALEAFEKARDMDRGNVWFQYRSIACMAALNRYGECLVSVSSHLTDRLSAADKSICRGITADLYILRGRIHARLGNTALCYYDTRDALHLDPDHSEAKRILQVLEEKAIDLKDQSVRLTINGRNRESIQRLTGAIEVDPSNPELHIHRGSVFRRLRNYSAAIDDYLLAIEKTGRDIQSDIYKRAKRQLLLTYNDFAVECCQKQFYDEAITLLNKALSEEKTEKGLYLNRGDCFFRQGNMTFALADYLQALEMDPSDFVIHERISEVHAYRAKVLFENKRYQEAETKLSVAVQYHPLSSDYYTLRSKARELLAAEEKDMVAMIKAMDVEGAQRDAIIALFLDQSNMDVMSLMARLYPGKSIREIMSSPEAVGLKEELDQLMAHRKPKLHSQTKQKFSKTGELQGISKSVELKMTELEEVKGKRILSATSLKLDKRKTSKEIQELGCYPEEREFQLTVVKEKKRMRSLIHKTLRGPLDLKKNRVLLPSRSQKDKEKATLQPHDQSSMTTVATQQQLSATRWSQLQLETSN